MRALDLAKYTAGVIAFAYAAQAGAAETRAREYEMSGTIVGLDSKNVIVQSADQTFEFPRRDPQLRLPAQAKVGDRISVWYRLDVTRAQLRKEEAGEAAPDTEPTPVLDDRIFYDARNVPPASSQGNEDS